MKTYKNIEFEINEGVAIITLNRADVLNSFNYEMADDTIDALTYSRDEKNIRAKCSSPKLSKVFGHNFSKKWSKSWS